MKARCQRAGSPPGIQRCRLRGYWRNSFPAKGQRLNLSADGRREFTAVALCTRQRPYGSDLLAIY